jgi:hypothetical protein
MIIMKVYFSKRNGRVVRVKEERCGKPYCSTEEYRKNLSRLNNSEREALEDFYKEEAYNEELETALISKQYLSR